MQGIDNAYIVRPHKWAKNLKNSKIISLLDLSHFGWSPHVNKYVRFLLSYLYAGLFLLDQPYAIHANVIKIVTTLSRSSEDPATTLTARDASI